LAALSVLAVGVGGAARSDRGGHRLGQVTAPAGADLGRGAVAVRGAAPGRHRGGGGGRWSAEAPEVGVDGADLPGAAVRVSCTWPRCTALEQAPPRPGSRGSWWTHDTLGRLAWLLAVW
jgi:hypothetical protein